MILCAYAQNQLVVKLAHDYIMGEGAPGVLELGAIR